MPSAYTTLLQQFYLAYFGRPADPTGLNTTSQALANAGAPTTLAGLLTSTNATVVALINGFGSSAESTALYTGSTTARVTAIYQNVLNRNPDVGGLLYWSTEIDSGRLSLARVALAVIEAGARDVNDGPLVTAKTNVAISYTAALDTVAEINAYNGNAAAASARTLLGTVVATTTTAGFQASVDANIVALVAANPGGTPGTSFALSTGTDTITGTANNDTITAGALAPDGVTAAATLNALDNIDGGSGTDTLVIDTTGNKNAIAGTVKNVENVTFIGGGTAVNGDVAITATSFTGAIRLQQTADTVIAVSALTGQTVITDRVADATVVTAAYAAAQATGALSNTGAVGNATFSVSGAALKTVTLATDATVAGKSVTVTDTGNTTTAFTLNSSASSTVTITSTALATVVVAGAGAVSLTTTTAPTTSVDASAAAGGVTLVTALAAGTTFTGGAGKDTITAGASTKALTTGAGNDTVNLSVALGSGGSVDAGDGIDTVSFAATDAVTASATTAFAATVSNFERFGVGLTAAATAINAANIDGITTIVSAGTGAANALTITNVAAASTLEVSALLASNIILTLKDATGASDVANLAFVAGNGFTSTGSIEAAGVETLNITATDTDATTAAAVFVSPIIATSVKSVVVTGNNGIDLTGLTATTLTSFDASGVTATGASGAVTITTGALAAAATLTGGAGNDVINAAAAVAATTLNGGAGNDTLTGSSTKASTINGGDGNDTIVGGALVDTIVAGAGNDIITSGQGLDVIDAGAGNDQFVVTGNINGNVYANITGFGAGDMINFIDGPGIATFTKAGITLAPTAAFADFLAAATAGDGGTNAAVSWFQFGGDTYLVQDRSAANAFVNNAATGDQVVRLVGLVNLANSTIDGAATAVLTIV